MFETLERTGHSGSSSVEAGSGVAEVEGLADDASGRLFVLRIP